MQFHGSSKPSGLNRTYPNEFTREGTRNYECYKWSLDMGADLDIAIPFTRLLAGATDYHLPRLPRRAEGETANPLLQSVGHEHPLPHARHVRRAGELPRHGLRHAAGV